jgi:ATP-dependent DNA helicase RecG
MDLSPLIADLRRSGGDTTNVEVKAAARGLSDSLTSTMSAMANLPGGGIVILGLDERSGFAPMLLKDPHALKQGLAAKARNLVPPVQLQICDAQVDGAPVIAAYVQECDPSAKPCRVKATGKAYLCGFDGDYELSNLEMQAFLAMRTPPMFDCASVEGATTADLDAALVDAFVRSVRHGDPEGRGRFVEQIELLRRSGVIDADGIPTVAGILALGLYPQQWFPRFVIQAAAEPAPGTPAAVRARNQVTIDGPIPYMLDKAMAWARRTFDSAIVTAPDGSVHDSYAYPLVAFRELIANALIHRDLDDWSRGLAVEVRLRRDRMIIGNPGGLYGIAVTRLGRESVTSARNARLVAICQHVYSVETGSRAIEALASGIPIVTEALAEVGLPPAHYIDAGIRFVAVLKPAAPPAEELQLGAIEQTVLDAISLTPVKVSDLETTTRLPAHTIRRALRSLRGLDLVEQLGRSKATSYRRTR